MDRAALSCPGTRVPSFHGIRTLPCSGIRTPPCPGTHTPSWPGFHTPSWRGIHTPSWPGLSGPPDAAQREPNPRRLAAGFGSRGNTNFNARAEPRRPRRLKIQALEQVLPTRILGFDQIQLPLPRPMPESFLASDGCQNLLVPFDINESSEPITRGEHRSNTLPMFPGASANVVRDPNIEGTECLVRHDVKPTAHHPAMIAVARLRKYQPHSEFTVRIGTSPVPVLAKVARTSRAMTEFVGRATTEFAGRATTEFVRRVMTASAGRVRPPDVRALPRRMIS